MDNAVLTSVTGEQYFDKTRPNKDTGYTGGLMSHSLDRRYFIFSDFGQRLESMINVFVKSS